MNRPFARRRSVANEFLAFVTQAARSTVDNRHIRPGSRSHRIGVDPAYRRSSVCKKNTRAAGHGPSWRANSCHRRICLHKATPNTERIFSQEFISSWHGLLSGPPILAHAATGGRDKRTMTMGKWRIQDAVIFGRSLNSQAGCRQTDAGRNWHTVGDRGNPCGGNRHLEEETK